MKKKIAIPDEFMGVPVSEETLKGTMSSVKTQQRNPQPSTRQVQVIGQINPRDYIYIPQHNLVIAREVGYKGRNWNDTLDALADDGLIMPRIDHFTTHFTNVRDAVNDWNKPLLYADGTPMTKEGVDQLWKYLSSTDRQGIDICCSWLDAKFVESGGKLKIETDHRRNSSPNIYDLKRYTSGKFVDLKFNDQGLPTRKSGRENYSQGDNIYFWEPADGAVAGFYADSVRSDLDCDRNPSNFNSSLGVFSCAEGVALRDLGGSN
jgi:hypothetical protein